MALPSATNSQSNYLLGSGIFQYIKILHVDDDEGFLATTKQILELQNPFHVETASSVREALEKLEQLSFDVVVSDYQMPEKDGLTFLNELRELSYNLPFILFTGKGREEVAIKALNLGADYYINKLGHPGTVYPQLSHYILQAVKKKRSEQKLQSKIELESVVTSISSRFVNATNFDKAVDQSLAEIGQLSKASRAYLFLLTENRTTLKNTHEWCNEGVTPQIANLQNLSCELFPCWMKKLYNHEMIREADISLMPPEAKAEKELLESQDIKSILILPVNLSGVFTGFIGFDNVNNSGFWGSEDVVLLQLVSEILGNSLERQQAYEKLKENEERYRLLTENITDVIFIQDMSLKVTYVSPSIKTVAGYGPEEVYKLKPNDFMTRESFERGIQDFKEALSLISKNPDSEIPLKRYEYIRKDGTKFWGELKTTILFDSEGNPNGLQGILRDITERKKTEEKLKASEENYRLLTENITDVVFIQDLNFNIVYASPSVELVTGYTPEEALTIKPTEFLTPDSYERALANYKSAVSMADELPENYIRLMQYEYVRKDGSTFWGELKVKFLRDSKGHLLGTQGTLRDITERKITEEKLKESEEKYRLLTENTTDVIFIQNLDLSIKYVSPSVEILSGYTPEEVIALGPTGIMTPESYKLGLVEIQSDLAKSAQDPNFEASFRCYEYIRKDGTTGWGEFKPKILRDSEGNIIAMQGTLRDVTERKKAEIALREEQQKLETVTGTLKVGLGIISKDFKVLWANKFLTDACGEVIGKNCYSVFNDLGTICPNCGVKEIFETGKDHVVCEQSVPYGNGERGWVELTANSIRDELGNIVAASELSVVIDDRKKMENKLRDAEKRYRFLFDKAPAGIFIVDLNGNIVEFNDIAHRQLGYSREEFEKLCVADFEVLETKDEILARIKRVQEFGKDEFESKHRTKNGEIRDIVSMIQLIELNGKPFLYVICRDVTEQKKAELKLFNTEKKYREMISAMTDLVWVIDFDGNITDVNDSAVEVLGYSRVELLSMKVKQIDLGVPAIESEGVCERLHAGFTQVFRSVYTTKDGRNIPVEVNANPVLYDNAKGILCIARDITERKKTEESLEKIMNELLMNNEKLSVVGKLTRHDVRNKLSVISNNIYLARKQLAQNKDVSSFLDTVDSAVEHVDRIFSFARTYEQLGVEELSNVDVKTSVDEAVSLFSGVDGVTFVNCCSGLYVMADSLLRQILYNLIDDSLKHGEKVTRIKVYYEEKSEQLNLVYQDNGIGIPENEKELSFKEGYGKHTGYGLYLIRKICEVYGWTITETGNYGECVKFVMRIPKFDKNNKSLYTIELG